MRKLHKFIWGILIVIIGLSPLIGAIFSPRVFYEDYNKQLTDSLPSSLVLQWGGWLTNSILVLLLLVVLITKDKEQKLKNSVLLWFSAVLFKFFVFLSSLFGAYPSFKIGQIIVPIVFTIVLLLRPVSCDWFIAKFKLVLLIYVYGSVLAALLAPEFVIENNYVGLLPFRFHGLASHANILAPTIVLYLLLEYEHPSRFYMLNCSIALLTLSATQSKTTFITAMLSVLILINYYLYFRVSKKEKSLGLGIKFFILSIIIFVLPSLYEGFSRVVFENYQNITTLTGRTYAWLYTIEVWKNNVLFGYGPTLWNIDMRTQFQEIYHWAPPNAHNQFIQTLGESGILGLFSLIFYYFVLIAMAIRQAKDSKGISILLVFLIFSRSLTEIPLKDMIFENNFLIHFVVFTILILREQEIKFNRSLQNGNKVEVKVSY